MIKTLSYIGMTRTLNLNSYSIFVVKTVLHWSNDWKKESVLHFLWNLKWYVKRYDLFYSPWCCAGGYQKFWLSQFNGRWIFRCFNKEQVVFCVRWLDEVWFSTTISSIFMKWKQLMPQVWSPWLRISFYDLV